MTKKFLKFIDEEIEEEANDHASVIYEHLNTILPNLFRVFGENIEYHTERDLNDIHLKIYVLKKLINNSLDFCQEELRKLEYILKEYATEEI